MLESHELEGLAEEFLDGTDYLEEVVEEHGVRKIDFLKAIYRSEYSDIRDLVKEKLINELVTSTEVVTADTEAIIDRFRDVIEQYFFDAFMQYFEYEETLDELSRMEEYEDLVLNEFNNIVEEIIEEDMQIEEVDDEELVEEADSYDEDSMIIEDFEEEFY